MNPDSVAPSLIITVLLLLSFFELGVCRVEKGLQKVGGIRDVDVNGVDMESLARFAVEEHNKKENCVVKFVRLVKAKEQVVGGMMYHLTLEATDGGKIKVYETQVWVQPWVNFKKMQEFKASAHSSV